MKDKFYVIEAENSYGETGFIIDGPKGISMTRGVMQTNVTRFNTYELAERFIRKRINGKSVKGPKLKCKIRDNQYIIDNAEKFGLVAQEENQTMYTLQNSAGEYIFYDEKKESYYFENTDVGYCVWTDETQLKAFATQFDFPTTIKKLEGNVR